MGKQASTSVLFEDDKRRMVGILAAAERVSVGEWIRRLVDREIAARAGREIGRGKIVHGGEIEPLPADLETFFDDYAACFVREGGNGQAKAKGTASATPAPKKRRSRRDGRRSTARSK